MPRFTIVAFRKSYPIISMHFMGALKRYWGYGLLFVTIAAVVNNWFGPPALMLMSGAVSLYFLFQVPNWCGAVNRNGTFCRDNASGLVIGCHRRQHKWQKIKLTFVSAYWRRFGAQLKSEPIEGMKTITALLGLAGGIITLSVALVKNTVV
jgi:hypothetical protein